MGIRYIPYITPSLRTYSRLNAVLSSGNEKVNEKQLLCKTLTGAHSKAWAWELDENNL